MYNKNEIEKIKESFRKDFNLSKDDERYLDITINYNNKSFITINKSSSN